MKLKLLGVGNNAKTVKGDGSEYLTAIMYLTPADKVEGVNLCPMAVLAGCKAGCLDTAGRGQMNSVQAARMRKTVFWRDYRELFIDQLRQDIQQFSKYCKKKGIQACVRLNGTSDIRWENYLDMQGEFPEVQFYDYTKIYKRALKYVAGGYVKNYHLTYSLCEDNKKEAFNILKLGGNISAVFRKYIPKSFKNYNVINADETDLRFLDKFKNQVGGLICGLIAKGPAKKDFSGFVLDAQ